MTQRKIAVVTERRQTADFFVLEAKSCGCVATVLPTPPDMEEYDIAVLENPGAERSVTVIFKDGSRTVFDMPVPITRLRALYTQGLACGQSRESEGELKLYLSGGKEKTVMLKDKIISLTDGEWSVLSCLAQGGGKPVSRAELTALFGAERGNISDVYICRLRKKLEGPFGMKIINTVREKGYVLSLRTETVST